MSKLVCKKCKSTDVTAYTPGIFGDSRHRCNSCGEISFTADFVEPTLFDRITASPEVLAPLLVRTNAHEFTGIFYTSVIVCGSWNDEAEAIAATLEELNKVSK